ncbi:MAG TPA: serine/threonine-protein kinase [Pirellulaceae bacterium]|nr:serine/threonine-protein kinase [Pirellulaceae bacterium]
MSAKLADSAALESAIAEFLEAESSGAPLSRDEFLDRHSAIRSELESFLANHDAMLAVAAPLREALGHEVGTMAEPPRPIQPHEDVTLDAADPAALSQTCRERETIVRLGSYGDYELLKELGRGGMGVVYKAVHTRLKRVVALKMVVSGHLAASEELDRFRLEAQAAAGLMHPGIVPIFEAGEFQGLPYFSMGLVDGVSLAERIAQGPVPAAEAVRLVRKIVDAVAYAHSHGVIHRDLKPANIMLACETAASSDVLSLDACQPQITDFGLAKRLGVASNLTATGQILGTPSYMPPEQACGKQHEVGEGADIYALGAILYAMLSGRPPFVAENPVEVLLQVLEQEPKRLVQLQPGVPAELEAICLKCLEKRPADRYPSAAALGDDLDRFLRHEPPEARSATPWQFVRRWVRRQPVLAWHLIGLLVVFVLIQFVYLAHPHSRVIYHLQVCVTMAAWMVACFAFQRLMERDRTRELSHYLWCAADVWFLTGLLALVVAPRGLLASGYALIICASGLFFRAQLVTFTTLMAMGASLLLMLLPLEDYPPWHYVLMFEAVLGICGLAVGYQVWRLEILREYYQERPK